MSREDGEIQTGGGALVVGALVLSEAERELLLVESRILELLDEIAILEEAHCVDCPRTQEQLDHENLLAKARLRLVAQRHLERELLEQIKSSHGRRKTS